MTRKFNVIPGKHDPKDYKVEQHFSLSRVTLPPKVDLSIYCSKVEDQGELGSCTGNALVGALEMLENSKKIFDDPDDKFVDLSRLFVYFNERMLEGTIEQDAGAIIKDGITVLCKYGVCPESSWAYDPNKFRMRPSYSSYQEGEKRKVSIYARADQTEQGLKTVLASGYPIVFGFIVYPYFESSDMAKTGVLKMPGHGESSLGGHAVLMVGYDDSKHMFLVRNSWGEGWGQKGYFWMPYAYATNPGLASDFWVIRS